MPSKPHGPHSLLTVFRKVSVLMVFRLLSAIRPQIPYLLSKPNLLIAFFFFSYVSFGCRAVVSRRVSELSTPLCTNCKSKRP